MADEPGRVARWKSSATARYADYREAHPWLQHVVAAWGVLGRANGNQYAAAITYFSFLALFPLLLLGVSVTGFVLHSNPHLEQEFFARITSEVPGQFGSTLTTALHTAINDRAGVGVVGIVGVALAGSGWIANLRQAVDAVWSREPAKRNFVMARVSNLAVLGGLGVGLLTSIGLTAVGTSLTDQILRAVGLDDLPGAAAVVKVLGIAVAAAADSLIFWWVLARLPQIPMPRRIAVQGALFASVGFEILKIVGSYTIAHTAKSPTAGPFAGLLAVLIWIQLVARFLLFVCAWMQVQTEEYNASLAVSPDVPTVEDVELAQEAPSPTVVGATLIGAGAVAGAAATWALTRPKPPRS